MNTLRHLFSRGLLLGVLLSLAAGCGNRQTSAVLDDVETYIQDRPDSALTALRAIDTTTLNSRRLHAQYALLLSMALDKNWIDTTDVGVIMPAVAYYDRHPVGDQKAKAFYYLGRIQENQGNIPDASISFLKAREEVEHSDDVSLKALVYQAISNMYNKTYYDEEALRYTELSYALATEAGDSLKINAARYRMAQDLNNVGRYAESDSLYQQLIDNNQVHPNLRASLLCNYALNLVTRKEEYAQAITLFEEVIASKGTLGNTNFWGAYAYALTRCGNPRRAESIFQQLSAANGNTSIAYVYDYWKSQADAYLGDYDSAYRLQKAASDIQGENVKKVLKQSAIKAQKDFLEQANLESEKAARRRQIMAWSSTLLLLFIMLVLMFFFKRRKEINAQEKEELIEAYKSLTKQHSALSFHYSELSAEVDRIEKEKSSVRNKYIQLCQSHFNRIGRINEVLYYHTNDRNSNLYKELKKALHGIGMDNGNYSEFEKLLNESFDNVMVHFRNAFPNKRPRYYQLVSYLFAGFETTTICTIIPGFQKHNVYVEKFRLKQAIRQSDSPYKDHFLRMLS